MKKVKYSYVTYRYNGELYENEKYPGEDKSTLKAGIIAEKGNIDDESEIEIINTKKAY
jgi:hypothetical protein